MTRIIAALALLLADTAAATGPLYAVLPTQGVGATAEAKQMTTVMTMAIQEHSLAAVPSANVQAAQAAETIACSQSVVACGRLVGTATGATHVVISELWDQAGILELKIATLDVLAQSPPSWTSWKTENRADLPSVAKRAVLNALVPDDMAGSLSFSKLEPGADIFVDGIARDRTPLMTPIKLLGGKHAIEVRVTGKAPWSQVVDVIALQRQDVSVCVRGDAVTSSCADDDAFPALATAGAVTLGVAAVSAIVSVVSVFQANAAFDAFAANPGAGANDMVTWQTTAAATGITSGVLVLAGAAALVVNVVE